MENKIQEIQQRALSEIKSASDARALEAVKNRYLGRKGEIAALFGEMAALSPDEKKKAGAMLNELKISLVAAVNEKSSSFPGGPAQVKENNFDVTLPGKRIKRGSINILTQVMDELLSIFRSMGYVTAQGPEIETAYYNFEALNIPENHPSKDMWSTFYVEGGKLLRTHTSPVQIRFMEKEKPPFAAVFPGRVYRRDAADASHLPVFHQLEGLTVGKGITMSDLKGTLTKFLRQMFGSSRKVRFRPSYFPFTEPSAEVDVECFVCSGKGCRLCKGSGWLEILGSGMVDPNVFKAVKYDPEKISGFAFGMGIERIAMLKYGIEDIRTFFENDLRFLRQF
jgi:phenylalanyl-tRNA synthetase alpha chain